jgi:hypothetical protein
LQGEFSPLGRLENDVERQVAHRLSEALADPLLADRGAHLVNLERAFGALPEALLLGVHPRDHRGRDALGVKVRRRPERLDLGCGGHRALPFRQGSKTRRMDSML